VIEGAVSIHFETMYFGLTAGIWEYTVHAAWAREEVQLVLFCYVYHLAI